MVTKPIRYIAVDYRFQLVEPHEVQTTIFPPDLIVHGFISLTPTGVLRLDTGFPWNGANVINNIPFVGDHWEQVRAPSAEHDALFTLMNVGKLDLSHFTAVNKLFRRRCKEKGVPHLVAEAIRRAVEDFGEQFANRQQPEILTAP